MTEKEFERAYYNCLNNKISSSTDLEVQQSRQTLHDYIFNIVETGRRLVALYNESKLDEIYSDKLRVWAGLYKLTDAEFESWFNNLSFEEFYDDLAVMINSIGIFNKAVEASNKAKVKSHV